MASSNLPSTDFGDLLQSAEQLTAEFETQNVGSGSFSRVSSDLPRVERNLAQLVEAGQQLFAKTVSSHGARSKSAAGPSGSEEVKAAVLLGSQGVDLPGLKRQLAHLTSSGVGKSGGLGEPLEPLRHTDIAGFLRNERENAILSVIEETRRETFVRVEKLHWEAMSQEWEMDKKRILHALGGSSSGGGAGGNASDLMDISRSVRPELSRVHDSTLHGVRSTLDHAEVAYADQVTRYNEGVTSGSHSLKPDMLEKFAALFPEERDGEISVIWDIVKGMATDLPPPPSNVTSAGQWRSSPNVQKSLVNLARTYLEKAFKKFVTTTVFSNMQKAQLGGIPGTFHLVKSFLNVKISASTPGLEDGTIEGVPVWAMIYYCLRCGDVTAATQAAAQAGQGLAEMVKFLGEISASADSRLSPHSDNIVRLSYRRAIRNTTDPFKRAVYCLLGACNPSDEHSEIATSLDDYLWIKLTQIREEASLNDSQSQQPMEVLTLTQLQTLMSEEYGESHFNAYEQPILYFQVLFLTGQFEAAVDFLFRVDRLRAHAVHIALVLFESNLLLLPHNIQAGILSKESSDKNPTRRLNIARIIMLYVRKFESTDPKEALQYFYFLRSLRGAKNENLFMSCVSQLVLESREFDLLLGTVTADGSRSAGLVDRLQNNASETQKVIEMVAGDSEQKGMFEDSVKLYDLARKHERVIELLNKLLAQVISQPSVLESRRDRLQRSAVEVAKRYRSLGSSASKESTSSFYLLLDLMTFFDFYHAKKFEDALCTILKIGIVPFSKSEIDSMVANFRVLQDEVRRNIPEILLACMNIIYTQYSQSKSATPGRGSGQDGGRERQLEGLRERAKALITFAGMIPYRMPGDTNSRLVQMEVLMN